MKKLLLTLFFVVFTYSLTFAQTATPPSAGNGTSGNPYQIASLENLSWIASNTVNWNKYYLQTANINASITSSWFSGAGWAPIGNSTTKFTGSYNGNGHTIDGLFINRPLTNWIGLFGVTNGAVIDSIGITNANIIGDTGVGGLVGANWFYSTVSKCYSSGSIKGKQCIGGLVGRNDYSPVSNSYSTASINGNSAIGGLVGLTDFSAVSNCYSTGNVSGSIYSPGGLVGDNSSLSTVSNSFWDTQTSGQGTSAGGTGITTVEMKTPITFSLVGWDDTGTIWKIGGSINNGYPFLSWQNPGGTPLPRTIIAPSAGDGTSGNPYQIATLENLYWIAFQANSGTNFTGVYFEQTANINASVTSSWFSGAGWTPIGNDYPGFAGHYNGNGHTIDRLFINRPSTDYIGLFGETGGSVIDGIGITNANITGSSSVGCLVGFNLLSPVSNCYSSGSVSGTKYVGGLVGYTGDAVNNCYSAGSVRGTEDVGGLVGYNGSTVNNCYSAGSVSGTGSSVGGLVGWNYYSSIVNNSYFSGSVSGIDDVGGLVGFNDATVNNCYSSGRVSGTGSPVGGLVGGSYEDTVNNSFWNIETSGKSYSHGGTGKTTAEMKIKSTFSLAGWSGSIWYMDAGINNGYPYLSWQNPGGIPLPETVTPPSAGNGTSGNPYQIASLNNLYWIALYTENWDKFYKQTANINASVTSSWFNGAGWKPIGNGTTNFTGHYNGNGHTIDSLFINRPSTDYIGLFGYTNGAVINSLRITNASITGHNYVGGLVGYNTQVSTVSNSYSTGSVSGTNYVGGLVGYNTQVSTVSNSYSTGSVSGYSTIGGLVGENDYSVSNSYSTGSVNGNQTIGGLVGENDYSVSNCYSIGSVNGTYSVGGLVGWNNGGSVHSSFWDTVASGRSTSAGGTGKTTAEMKTTSTFIDAGWDFTAVWQMTGTNYPDLINTKGPPDTSLDGLKDEFYNKLTGPNDGYIQLRSYAFNDNGSPTDDADLSAKIWTAWDNDWFHLYEEVMDDTLSANATNVWEEDEIELKFDPQPTDSVTNSIWDTRLTALDAGTGVVAWDNLDNVSASQKLWARRTIPGGYALELAIKWSAIKSGNETITPAVGNIFGMAICQHDNDGHARRQASVEWAAVLLDAVYNTPKYLGTVKFLADNKLQFIPTNNMTGRTNPIPYDGSDYPTGIKNASTTIPETFNLGQNYPNPFNPSTTFRIALPIASNVKLVVLNILGQEVTEVVNKHLAAGTYDFSWNAKNLSSGVYFFKLTANQYSSVRKMMLLK